VRVTENRSDNIIAPWLSLRHSNTAMEFYKAAFGAVETYRLDTPEGVIARLSVGGAQFWISPGEPAGEGRRPSAAARFGWFS